MDTARYGVWAEYSIFTSRCSTVTGSGEVHVFAEGRRVDLDGLPRTLNPDAGF